MTLPAATTAGAETRDIENESETLLSTDGEDLTSWSGDARAADGNLEDKNASAVGMNSKEIVAALQKVLQATQNSAPDKSISLTDTPSSSHSHSASSSTSSTRLGSIIPRDMIELSQLVGSGAFGDVYKGKLCICICAYRARI